jgi:hypothetical protein
MKGNIFIFNTINTKARSQLVLVTFICTLIKIEDIYFKSLFEKNRTMKKSYLFSSLVTSELLFSFFHFVLLMFYQNVYICEKKNVRVMILAFIEKGSAGRRKRAKYFLF